MWISWLIWSVAKFLVTIKQVGFPQLWPTVGIWIIGSGLSQIFTRQKCSLTKNPPLERKAALTHLEGRCCVWKLHPSHPPLCQRSSGCEARRLGAAGPGTVQGWTWTCTATPTRCQLPRSPPGQFPPTPPGGRWNPAAGNAAVGWWCGWWCGGTGLCKPIDKAAPPPASSFCLGPRCRWGYVSAFQKEAEGAGRRLFPWERPRAAPGLPGTETWTVWSGCAPERSGSCCRQRYFASALLWTWFPRPSARRSWRSEEEPWKPERSENGSSTHALLYILWYRRDVFF